MKSCRSLARPIALRSSRTEQFVPYLLRNPWLLRPQISGSSGARDPLRSPPNRPFPLQSWHLAGPLGLTPLSPAFFIFLTKLCHGTYPLVVEVTKRGLMRGYAGHHRERADDGRRTPNKGGGGRLEEPGEEGS